MRLPEKAGQVCDYGIFWSSGMLPCSQTVLIAYRAYLSAEDVAGAPTDISA